MTSKHCCLQNKCKGEKFSALNVKCKYCSKPIFVECVLNECKSFDRVLVGFNLFKRKLDMSCSEFYYNKDERQEQVFKDTFNGNTPFTVICIDCDMMMKKRLKIITSKIHHGYDEIAKKIKENVLNAVQDVFKKQTESLTFDSTLNITLNSTVGNDSNGNVEGKNNDCSTKNEEIEKK